MTLSIPKKWHITEFNLKVPFQYKTLCFQTIINKVLPLKTHNKNFKKWIQNNN